MKKYEKEILQSYLDDEEAVIKQLESTYNRALNDVVKKSKELQAHIDSLQDIIDTLEDGTKKAEFQSMKQAKVYQKQYQDALMQQLNGILDNMHAEEFKAISEYTEKCYEQGWLGTMYSLQQQGIPIITPINQEAVIKAVLIDSKIKENLYTSLGEDVKQLKKNIASEISRGISTGASYSQIAQQIKGQMVGVYDKKSGGALYRAETIARTEGHRVQIQSAMDASQKAKEKGCDVLKQWDSSLDKRTRPSHRRVDGEIKELDEPFSNGLMYPGDSEGGAGEVVNCRCALLQRARWALDEEELEELKRRAEYFGLDKTDNFNDFKQKYLKAVEEDSNPQKLANSEELTNRRKERQAARKAQTKNTSVEINAEMSADEIDKVGRHNLYGHWEEYRKKFLGNSVPVDFDKLDDEYGSYYDKVKLGKYKDKETVGKILNTIDELSAKFYSPVDRLRWMDEMESFGNTAFASTSQLYGYGSAEIRFNPLKLNAKGIERIAEVSRTGWTGKIPKGREIEYITTHEFGHSIMTFVNSIPTTKNWVQQDFAPTKAARKEIGKLWDSYSKTVAKLETEYKALKKEQETKFLFEMIAPTPEELKELEERRNRLDATKISTYSLSNSDEFMAEAFADAVINGDNALQYSKDVYNVIVKYFGKE